MDPQTSAIAEPPATNWLAIAFCIGIFTAGFWVIDHTPFASNYFASNSLIAESENRTADRIEAVNLITAPVRILLGVLGVAFLLFPTREKLKWGGILLLLMAAYVIFCGASAAWSVNQQVTMQKFLVLCFFSMAAIGVARYFNIRELAIIFASVCVLYIAIGVAVEIALGNFAPHKKYYRFVGTCHPNSLAVYGTFGCLVSIVYFNQKPNWNHLLCVLFLVGIATLVLTKSRTTLAAFAFAAMATWFMTFKPNNRVFAIAVTLLLFVLIGFVLTLSKSNLRAATAEKLAMGRTQDVSTLTGRLPLWELLMESVEERPLTGYGYLAYWDKEKIEYLSDQLKWEVPHGHNMYLDVMLDGGIVALLLYIAIFLAALSLAAYRGMYFLDRDAILVFGFLVFAIVHGFAESLFKLPTFLLFMLVVLAIRLAFQPIQKPEQTSGDLHPPDIFPEPAA